MPCHARTEEDQIAVDHRRWALPSIRRSRSLAEVLLPEDNASQAPTRAPRNLAAQQITSWQFDCDSSSEAEVLVLYR
jgi:transcription antitermination factor NusA-like protein